MAAIARLHLPLKAPLIPATSNFSPLCLRASTPSKCVFRRTRFPIQSRYWSARTFSVSARVQAKKYTQDHEWIELSEDGKLGTIGITTYAASALGDVVYIELPQPGQEVSSGDTIGAVESVKSASDILTPVSGKIVSANEELEVKPGIINQSPEREGWIARIEVVGEVGELMDEEGYRKFTEEV